MPVMCRSTTRCRRGADGRSSPIATPAAFITTERNLERLLDGPMTPIERISDDLLVGAARWHGLPSPPMDWADCRPRPDSLDPSPTSLHPLHIGLDRRAERRGAHASERRRLRRMGGGGTWRRHGRCHRRRSPRSRSTCLSSTYSAPCAPAARLAPIHESAMISPVTLARAIAGAGATVLYCVPSLVLREIKWHELGWAELGGSALRQIVFAGEPIDHQALARFGRMCPTSHCIIGTGRPRPMSAAIIASPTPISRAARPFPSAAHAPMRFVTSLWDDARHGEDPRPASCWSRETR